MKMKNLASAIAIAATMGATSTASADIINMSFEGDFVMITPAGGVLTNPDAVGAAGGDAFGVRTPISGTMFFDTDTNTGGGTVGAFNFSGTNAQAHDITMAAIGDGGGIHGTPTLVMGSMLFDYGPTLDIPVYLIADAAGLFGAIGGGVSVGDTITGGAASSVDAPIDASPYGTLVGDTGNVPFAMTTYDVNQSGDAANTCGTTGATGALIGGGFPLCDDGVSGVRMATAPFPGHGANFDISSMTVTSIETSAVPVPAAVWLFGSGLVGLAGVARRRKSA